MVLVVTRATGLLRAEEHERHGPRRPRLLGEARELHHHRDTAGVVLGARRLRHRVEVGADDDRRLVGRRAGQARDDVQRPPGIDVHPPGLPCGNPELLLGDLVAQGGQAVADDLGRPPELPGRCLPRTEIGQLDDRREDGDRVGRGRRRAGSGGRGPGRRPVPRRFLGRRTGGEGEHGNGEGADALGEEAGHLSTVTRLTLDRCRWRRITASSSGTAPLVRRA